MGAAYAVLANDSQIYIGHSSYISKNRNKDSFPIHSVSLQSLSVLDIENVKEYKVKFSHHGEELPSELDYSFSIMNPPVSTSSAVPSTTFDGQDFRVGNLVTEFQNVENTFSLQLNYTVGGSVSKLGMTLYYENCTTPYVDRNDETKVIELGVPMSTDISVKKINIIKENFSVSTLVTKKKGNSVGEFAFCVKAESMMGNNLSVSFQKDNIKLSYDLSKNVFTVNGNKIRENNATVSSTK